VEEFKRALFSICPAQEEPATPVDDGLADFLVYRPQSTRRRFRIYRTDRGFRVIGDASEQELEDALRAIGIRKGTEVEVSGETLEWE
jgi:hypothetical protein